MCCSIGHPCNCNKETEGMICQDCFISIPKTFNGLCNSCKIDRRLAEDQ